MLDIGWLRQWIRPVHLETGALREYRRRFKAQAGPYVVLEDFLPDDLARAASGFLTDEALYRRSRGLYFVGHECSDEEWREAEERRRFFSYRVLAEEQWRSPPSPNAASYLGLRTAMADRKFASFFAAATGLSFDDDTEVGTHGMQRGDFLKMHRDLGHNRRLAFLLYLSPGWDPAWGGVLHLIDDEGTETVIEPGFNRLLLFDVIANRGHYVSPIEEAAGSRSRLSLGGWLHHPASESSTASDGDESTA